MRVCLCLLIALACAVMLGTGVANAVDYSVPFADLLYQQWTCVVEDHWSMVDEHDGTTTPGAVDTRNFNGVTDQYDAHIEDGTYSGPYDHMEQIVWARSLGTQGANLVTAYYHTGLLLVCGVEAKVMVGQWHSYTGATVDPETIEELWLWGKRVLPAGALRVDEIHVRYW
jgi:hypothetical protein